MPKKNRKALDQNQIEDKIQSYHKKYLSNLDHKRSIIIAELYQNLYERFTKDPHDLIQATIWFFIAAHKGNVNAMHIAAVRCIKGYGTDVDLKRGRDFAKLAAVRFNYRPLFYYYHHLSKDLNEWTSILYVAIAYLFGKGVAINEKKAKEKIIIFCNLIDVSIEECFSALHKDRELYFNSHSATDIAIKLLTHFSHLSNIKAILLLTKLLDKKNHRKAATLWYEKAGMLGSSYAMDIFFERCLARIYADNFLNPNHNELLEELHYSCIQYALNNNQDPVVTVVNYFLDYSYDHNLKSKWYENYIISLLETYLEDEEDEEYVKQVEFFLGILPLYFPDSYTGNEILAALDLLIKRAKTEKREYYRLTTLYKNSFLEKEFADTSGIEVIDNPDPQRASYAAMVNLSHDCDLSSNEVRVLMQDAILSHSSDKLITLLNSNGLTNRETQVAALKTLITAKSVFRRPDYDQIAVLKFLVAEKLVPEDQSCSIVALRNLLNDPNNQFSEDLKIALEDTIHLLRQNNTVQRIAQSDLQYSVDVLEAFLTHPNCLLTDDDLQNAIKLAEKNNRTTLQQTLENYLCSRKIPILCKMFDNTKYLRQTQTKQITHAFQTPSKKQALNF